jgi:hypothetical protein
MTAAGTPAFVRSARTAPSVVCSNVHRVTFDGFATIAKMFSGGSK